MSNRLSKAFVALALAAPLAPLSAAPAVGPARAGHEIHIVSPRFVATAVKFKALDETGWDWTGSDEVYAVFADFNPVAEDVSTLFGDVDSGETRTFQADDSCLAPQPKCDHGVSSLHFAFSLWEEDRWGFADWFDLAPPVAPNSHVNYDDGLSGSDDLIGRHEVNLSQAQLVTMLPSVGNVIETTVKPTGGSGSYAFTYRITRLANVERTIVIHEPQTLGISLQASLENPPSAGKVSLTWSGATSASVDILRGAALVATTANDGQYTDNVSNGTYQYRVCEAGMTICSASVSITVP